jgi:uncharacterized protein
MEYFALGLLILVAIAGFAAIFFTTFGTFIILLGAIAYGFLTNFTLVSGRTLAIVAGLYVIGEVLEYVFVVFGVKKAGASHWAILGALVGGAAGAIFGFPLLGVGLFGGMIVGIFLGAFLVELIIHRDLFKSVRAGAGGVIGRLGSIVTKVFIAIAMVTVLALQIT